MVCARPRQLSLHSGVRARIGLPLHVRVTVPVAAGDRETGALHVLPAAPTLPKRLRAALARGRPLVSNLHVPQANRALRVPLAAATRDVPMTSGGHAVPMDVTLHQTQVLLGRGASKGRIHMSTRTSTPMHPDVIVHSVVAVTERKAVAARWPRCTRVEGDSTYCVLHVCTSYRNWGTVPMAR